MVLQSLLQIRTYMLEGSPFDLATQTVKHTEMNDMLKEIKYYQMVVCFIKTIKSRDATNREELSKFLKPMEGSKNLSAQVYLFNFFMKELSEKSTEKAGISKLSEDARAGANDLVRSIQFGHKLYSSSLLVTSSLRQDDLSTHFFRKLLRVRTQTHESEYLQTLRGDDRPSDEVSQVEAGLHLRRRVVAV